MKTGQFLSLFLILLIHDAKSVETIEGGLAVIERCPLGRWKEFENKCYAIYGGDEDKGRNFAEARLFCELKGGSLVTIKSLEEQNFLTALLASTAPAQPIWIGLVKPDAGDIETAPKWIDGSSESHFRNYGVGQPDGGLDEKCFSMNNEEKGLGQWMDEPCSTANSFICERNLLRLVEGWCPVGFTRYRESCYILKEDKVDFWSAEGECRAKHGSRLVSIRDPVEESLLTKLAAALRDKLWMEFPHLHDDETKRSASDKCVAISAEGGGWTLENCLEKFSFVCTKRTTKHSGQEINIEKIKVGEDIPTKLEEISERNNTTYARLNATSSTTSKNRQTDENKYREDRLADRGNEDGSSRGNNKDVLSREAIILISVGLGIIVLELVAIACIIYRRRCFFEHAN